MFSARAPDAARGMHDFKRAGERVGKTPEIFNGSLRKEAPGPSPHVLRARCFFHKILGHRHTHTARTDGPRDIPYHPSDLCVPKDTSTKQLKKLKGHKSQYTKQEQRRRYGSWDTVHTHHIRRGARSGARVTAAATAWRARAGSSGGGCRRRRPTASLTVSVATAGL